MIIKYNRLDGVPENHYALFRVISFGDFGSDYQDEILYYSDTKDELEEFCEEGGFVLKDPTGWNEYRITTIDKRSDSLKPCPFCGRDDHLKYWQDRVVCICGCMGPPVTMSTDQKVAFSKWNQRRDE